MALQVTITTKSWFILFSLLLVALGYATTALAQKYRKEDLSLLSQAYQDRIVQSAHVNETARHAMKLWQSEINGILRSPKAQRPTERDLHEQFFTDILVNVLGYEKRTAGQSAWTLRSEYVTDVDKTRPDGVLGFFADEGSRQNVQVVIELKGPGVDLDLRQNRKQDRRTPVDQAFSYAHKFDDVSWVIVSNYSEVRLYNKRSSKYALQFDLTKITDNEHDLKLFILLLWKGNLITDQGISTTSALYAQRVEELEQITNRFYADYGRVRLATARNILKNNPGIIVDTAVTYA